MRSGPVTRGASNQCLALLGEGARTGAVVDAVVARRYGEVDATADVDVRKMNVGVVS